MAGPDLKKLDTQVEHVTYGRKLPYQVQKVEIV